MQQTPPDATNATGSLEASGASALGIPSLVGDRFNDRYEIVRVLSSGGMGAVYEATDTRTGAPRAIKVLLPTLVRDAEARARFELEAHVIASIESPHVIRVFDMGIDATTQLPFIVMELLHGNDLFTWLARHGRLAAHDVATFLSQLALGLATTHRNGIVHRDLKPENVFVAEQPVGPPVVKVLDFGIAKVLDSGAHLTHAAMGTPLYMAPEQLGLAAELGPRADLHAVGHLAFTMLVGVPYWDREPREEGLYKLITKVCLGVEEPASKRAMHFGVSLDAAFDAWFARSVARMPSDRYPGAIDQALALAEALGEPPLPALVAAKAAQQAVDESAPRSHEMAQSYPAIAAPFAAAKHRPLHRVLVAVAALLLVAVAALVVIIDRRARHVGAPTPAAGGEAANVPTERPLSSPASPVSAATTAPAPTTTATDAAPSSMPTSLPTSPAAASAEPSPAGSGPATGQPTRAWPPAVPTGKRAPNTPTRRDPLDDR